MKTTEPGRADRTDRDLLIGFAAICGAVLLVAVVFGLAVRAFMIAAGL